MLAPVVEVVDAFGFEIHRHLRRFARGEGIHVESHCFLLSLGLLVLRGTGSEGTGGIGRGCHDQPGPRASSAEWCGRVIDGKAPLVSVLATHSEDKRPEEKERDGNGEAVSVRAKHRRRG